MQEIMNVIRDGINSFGGKKVIDTLDYINGRDGLPKSDVIKYLLEDNCSVVVRPSGTEPKLKVYISASASTKTENAKIESRIFEEIREYFE